MCSIEEIEIENLIEVLSELCCDCCEDGAALIKDI
jgi:hypothetical protein